MNLSHFHVINKPLDAIETVRERSISGDVDDDPFYICNISDIIRKHRNWQQCMPRIIPFYAVKCNDSPIVIQTLAALGTGFDCASKGEITKVLSYGVSPEAIIYANPTKPISHLNLAARMNVSVMTVDSDFELYKIAKHFPNARLVLRIRFDAEKSELSLGEKYGCDPELEAPGLIELSRSLGLHMIGISFHVGSGCKDPPVYARATKVARKLFDFAVNVGYNFKLLDIGGGFPGNTGSNNEFREIASIVNYSVDKYFPSPDVTIIAEPGRYYVTSAYTLACQVHSKREIFRNGKVQSTMYYINEGVYGQFCDFLCKKIMPELQLPYPVTLKPVSEERFKSSLWGPTCDSLDQLFENIPLPRLNIGDFIIFENMGSYTMSLASSFNGFSPPKVEYYIEHKHQDIITAATSNSDYTLLQNN